MGTSGSANSGRWTVRVLVYSGRRDPEWPAPAGLIARAMAIWDRLAPVPKGSSSPGVLPPPLGYRGCVLSEPGGRRWAAFGGIVSLTAQSSDRAESRRDRGRAFERLLAHSAAPGVLPPGIVIGPDVPGGGGSEPVGEA